MPSTYPLAFAFFGWRIGFRVNWWGCALVAQGIEHRSPKAGVGRSNRLGGTKSGGMPYCAERWHTLTFCARLGSLGSGVFLFAVEHS